MIALRHFGKVAAELKPDRSLVTEADREVERFLVERLRAIEPEAQVLAEEGTAAEARDDKRPTWAVDPIDGTAVFVAGLPSWSISVGFIRDGQPELGCVYLPIPDEMFLADVGAGCSWNGSQVEMKEPTKADWLAVPSNFHRRFRSSYPGKHRCLGSTAAHIAWTARGAAAAAISYAHLWDIAGALACCRASGVAYRYLSGARFRPSKEGK